MKQILFVKRRKSQGVLRGFSCYLDIINCSREVTIKIIPAYICTCSIKQIDFHFLRIDKKDIYFSSF